MKKILKNLLHKAGYNISSLKYVLKTFETEKNLIPLNFDLVMSRLLMGKENPDNFSFIQVGAFDGITCDPLRKYLEKYNWRGVMAEPQPVPFNKLLLLYNKNENINIVNAAIGKTKGTMKLFILEGNELPEWSKGMASFSKENLAKHRYLIPQIEKYIKEIEVPVTSFSALFELIGNVEIDLLQIDTEGFDAEIIRMFPFEICKPNMIHFESKHIEKIDLEKLLQQLIDLNYLIARDGAEDMMAVQKAVFE